MTDWIWMLFRVVSGVGRGMAVLDGVVIVEQEATVLGVNLGTSHCNTPSQGPLAAAPAGHNIFSY